MYKLANAAIEERMMSEYIAQKLPAIHTWTHLRLGMPPGVQIGAPNWQYERQIKMPALLEADLVYMDGRAWWIVEFKVRRFQEAIGKLQQYKLLLPETPGFELTRPEYIKLKIVFGRPDPNAERLAGALDIAVEQFEPAWLKQMIADRSGGPV
jgi:hypothetical protein